MFKVRLLPDAEESFKKLDIINQQRVARKIDWLAEYAAQIVHHSLSSLPEDLRGLCRIRVGDYRILYWIYNRTQEIKIYEIEHRSKDYRSLKK